MHTHSRVSLTKESAKNGLTKNNKVTLIFFLLPRYFFSGFFSVRFYFLRYFLFSYFSNCLSFLFRGCALSRSLHSTACQTDELHIAAQNASKLEIGSHYDATRSFIFHSTDFPPFCACFARFTLSRRLSGHQRLANSSWVSDSCRCNFIWSCCCALTVDCRCHSPRRAPNCPSPCQAVLQHKNCIVNKTGFCFIAMREFRTIYEMCFVLFVVLTSQKTAGELERRKANHGSDFREEFFILSSSARASSPEFPHAHNILHRSGWFTSANNAGISKEGKCVCLVHLNAFRDGSGN